MNVLLVRVALVLACIACLSGCSKFKSSTRMDMGPFAENTTTLLVEAQKILQPLPWYYLREYQRAANTEEINDDVEVIRDIFRGVGMYSIQVVSLNASRMPDEKRAGKLADYLAEVLQPMLDAGAEEKYGLSRSMVDSTLAGIRGSTTFMQAIGEADPMIYSIVQFGIARLDAVRDAIEPSFVLIAVDIEARYAGTRAEIERLDASEAADVETYLALQDYRVGKGTREAVVALDPLLAGPLAARDDVIAYEKAQSILRRRLAATDSTRAQLAPKVQDYRNRSEEVGELSMELDRRVRAGRMMLVYWLRAHRNLAQGIQVPPAINVGQMVGSSAKKAVGAVVP
ncbi:MAG: hypothetical protein OEX18_11470 [Candidatus Krumholzibacteria bacterium]|nr:hypothetical protein [Candidatus Krumholzibacteria bacterium]MDH4337880.1 hypothetical protein [Candidatus Krumholzibacteria bacterium]MDH5270235.1 hypothetical protein [Candidatus Krumholzibacteria bacterium]MDH5627114.1 hypothetical protein [Candidatus Krumholzibacteria bacterium]